MAFSTLSDDFTDDSWHLSDAAFRLHVEGIGWSNRKLLDMQIPRGDLQRFKTPGAVDELIHVGFWEETPEGYSILHHARYQRTREQVIASQNRSRTNGKKGGRPPKAREVWPQPETQRGTYSETQQLTQTGTQQVSEPVREGAGREAQKPRKQADQNPERNPVANPASNPKGKDSLDKEVLPSSAENPYPTDAKAVKFRQWIDGNGITSPSELAEARGMGEAEAVKVWAQAFPGWRAA